MMFAQNRQQTRAIFYRAWQKHRRGQSLEGIETIIVEVLINHPEYQLHFDQADENRVHEISSDGDAENPFLHMGLHIAILEQLSIDQPQGIREIYLDLSGRASDLHQLQHRMMNCLGSWVEASQALTVPEHQRTIDADYLQCLRRLQTR